MADAAAPYSGGCACSDLRYHVKTAPLIVHACHCRFCQRQTGGPHVLNAVYEAEMVELTQGTLEKITVPSPSGKGQIIARCAACKTAVWSHYHFGGLRERITFLRAGTLDNPDAMPPDVHIFTSTKMPWYQIPEGHLAVEEYYDPREVWAGDKQARYKAWLKSSGQTD